MRRAVGAAPTNLDCSHVEPDQDPVHLARAATAGAGLPHLTPSADPIPDLQLLPELLAISESSYRATPLPRRPLWA
jgi:hypothetical protein